jgi:hypothetical protein
MNKNSGGGKGSFAEGESIVFLAKKSRSDCREKGGAHSHEKRPWQQKQQIRGPHNDYPIDPAPFQERG